MPLLFVENLNSHLIKSCLYFLFYPIIKLGSYLITRIHIIEQFFVTYLKNIYSVISQVLFFSICSLLLHDYSYNLKESEETMIVTLKTLMFFSVFTYFVTKTRSVLAWNQRSLFVNFSLVEALLRIVIEWAKAIFAVLYIRDQGPHFRPKALYVFVSAVYYLSTEAIFVDLVVAAMQQFHWEYLADLERLYIPFFINFYLAFLSAILLLCLFLTKHYYYHFIATCCYFLVYLHLKNGYFNYWRLIKLAQETFRNFRNANLQEIRSYDDVCAICLNKMNDAKITPCNHYFHGSCLRQSLKASAVCPICKYSFYFICQ